MSEGTREEIDVTFIAAMTRLLVATQAGKEANQELAAVCDEHTRVCTELATLRARLAEVERERDRAMLDAGTRRLCVQCGRTRPAEEGRGHLPECGGMGCTWDLTPQEAWQYWSRRYHELRAEADAMRAVVREADALRSLLKRAKKWVRDDTLYDDIENELLYKRDGLDAARRAADAGGAQA